MLQQKTIILRNLMSNAIMNFLQSMAGMESAAMNTNSSSFAVPQNAPSSSVSQAGSASDANSSNPPAQGTSLSSANSGVSEASNFSSLKANRSLEELPSLSPGSASSATKKSWGHKRSPSTGDPLSKSGSRPLPLTPIEKAQVESHDALENAVRRNSAHAAQQNSSPSATSSWAPSSQPATPSSMHSFTRRASKAYIETLDSQKITVKTLERCAEKRVNGNLKTFMVHLINPQLKLNSVYQSDNAEPSGSCIISCENVYTFQTELMRSGILQKSLLATEVKDAVFCICPNKEHANQFGMDFPYLADKPAQWLPLEYICRRADSEIELPAGYYGVIKKVTVRMNQETNNPLFYEEDDYDGSGEDAGRSSRANIGQPSPTISHRSRESIVPQQDSMLFDFSPFLIECDPLVYLILFNIASKLLFYNDPTAMHRNDRQKSILLSTGKEDISKLVSKVLLTRDKILQLQTALLYDVNLLEHDTDGTELDVDGTAEWTHIISKLAEQQDHLLITIQALKKMQSPGSAKDKAAFKTQFIAPDVVLKMILPEDFTLFAQWQLSAVFLRLLDFSDGAREFDLTIDRVFGKNLLPNAAYREVTDIFTPPQSTSAASQLYKIYPAMLQVHWRELPPVAGIAVVTNFEVLFAPIKFQMTYELGRHLLNFFFPARSAPVQHSNFDASSSNNSNPSGSSQPTGAAAAVGSTVSGSSPLSSPPSVPSLLSKKKGHHSHTMSSISSAGTSTIANQSSMSGSMATLNAPQSASNTPVAAKEQHSGFQRFAQNVQQTETIDEMKARASKNSTFINIRIPGVHHCLSYRGIKEKNLEDVHEFVLKTPDIEYHNKTWTWLEFLMQVRREIIIALIAHSGQLMKEKFFSGKKSSKAKAGAALPNAEHSNNDSPLRQNHQSPMPDDASIRSVAETDASSIVSHSGLKRTIWEKAKARLVRASHEKLSTRSASVRDLNDESDDEEVAEDAAAAAAAAAAPQTTMGSRSNSSGGIYEP